MPVALSQVPLNHVFTPLLGPSPSYTPIQVGPERQYLRRSIGGDVVVDKSFDVGALQIRWLFAAQPGDDSFGRLDFGRPSRAYRFLVDIALNRHRRRGSDGNCTFGGP